MELPIKPNSNLVTTVQRFFKPFLNTQIKQDKRFIMPLYEVEKLLHQHYVTLDPVEITFEYYDSQQEIEQKTVLANVVSTVQHNRRIAISEVNSKRSYILSLEQILTASANACLELIDHQLFAQSPQTIGGLVLLSFFIK